MGETVGAGSLPRQLGRYELITCIGNGGMADVYLARQRGPMGFEKLVVLKLAHPTLAAQKNFVEMLMREARFAALLKHANVVDVYELGEVDGTYYVAMEYLAGEPMLSLLRAGRDHDPLDPLSIARIIADAAEGLHAAHELRSLSGQRIGLVHHDVSPGNIMVLYSGQVKLVDFGVANAFHEALLDADGRKMVAGKLGYLAPEKLRGETFDHRSDLFSLGVVLWETLTCRRLYKGATDAVVRQQVLTEAALAPSPINSGVPAALDVLCLKALAKDPAQRYATAAEMAAALENVLRSARYNNKNVLISKYMRDTFASRLAVREQLVREASSAAGLTPSTVAATLELNRHAPLTEPPETGETPETGAAATTGVSVSRPSSANLAGGSPAAVASAATPGVIPSIRKGIAPVELPALARVPAPSGAAPNGPALASTQDAASEAVVSLVPLAPIVATAPRVALPGPTRQPIGSTPIPFGSGTVPIESAAATMRAALSSDQVVPAAAVVPADIAVPPPLPPVLPPATLPRMSTADAEFFEGPSLLIASDPQDEYEQPWQSPPRSRTPWIIGAVAVAVAGVLMIVVFGGKGGNQSVGDAAPLVAVALPDAMMADAVVDARPVRLDDAAGDSGEVDARVMDAPEVDAVRVAVVQENIVQKPAVQKPAVQKPAVQKPAVQKPAVQKPVTTTGKGPIKSTRPSRADLDSQYKAALQQFLKGDVQAIAGFRSIVRADASYATAWRGLGLASAKHGNKTEAAKALKKYLALAPNAADAGQIRARLEQLK